MGRFWASKDGPFEDMMQSEHRKKRLEIEKPVPGSFPGQGNSLGLMEGGSCDEHEVEKRRFSL